MLDRARTLDPERSERSMRTSTWIFTVAALAVAAPGAAQESSTAIRDAILGAARLPEDTREARILGVPESDIRAIFGAAREQRLPAGVLHEVLVSGNESIREHGPIDNFGAFVQSKLAQGLRGRDLAAAIRAEHAARGIGRGNKLRAPDGPGASGAAGDKAKGGKPDQAGKSGQGGKPDSPGKSGDNAGKKGGS
jgi:hypothetical protein